MKKYLSIVLFSIMAMGSFAQTGNIRFTARKSAIAANQILIYGKNITASTLSGIIGASNLTLCVTFPRIYSGLPGIASPIAGQLFDAPTRSTYLTDSVYSWNGLGTTSNVDFASNTEVLIATVTFRGPSPVSATVKLMNVPLTGSGFDYNYIALSGTEQSGYITPFYSNTTNDPLLLNAGAGPNDITAQTIPSSLGIAAVVLPTKFLSFYANKSDDNAKLTWTVDNEEDNNYFEVEASTDARTFKLVQKVSSLRNGRSSNTYTLMDSRISRYNVGTIYYRIKQVEANGRIIYSDVRQVTIDGKNFVAALYPNPVKTITKLVIEAPEAGKATVIIRDAAGKAVKQINLQLQKGTNQQELDATAFAAGDYNLTIMGDKLNQTIKLTKTN